MNRIAIALVMLRDLFTKDEDSVCGVCGERLPKVFEKIPTTDNSLRLLRSRKR